MEINFTNFKLLHNHLLSILSTNNFGTQNLPEKIMQYIGMVVEAEKSPKKSEDFFDYFCENSGNKILRLTLEADPFLAIKVLSMLFINLKSKTWISFLLCQQFVTESIQCEDIADNEEWAQYYISLLKSLSIRLNNDDLSLFFNKKFCKFPLLYESLKYYNHPDTMVRTNVMNIILGVMRIKDPRLSKYFGNFPFTSYILTLCCQIKERIEKFELHLLEWDYCQGHHQSPQTIFARHKSIVKMYFVDMSDYICYLNDLIELGSKELGFFIKNAISAYILLPALTKLKSQVKQIQKKSALYLIFILLQSINDDEFTETLCLLLFSKQLPKYYLNRIEALSEQLYIPKVYSSQFSTQKYYWNQFQYQIEKCCLRAFDDVANFQTDHDLQKQDQKQKEKFMTEINAISNFLGFNILDYSSIQGKMPISELRGCLGFMKERCFTSVPQEQLICETSFIRESVIQLFQVSCAQGENDFCLCICILLIYCVRRDCISNPVLKSCGLLMPKFDTVNYIDEFNCASLLRLKNSIMSSLIFLNKKFQNKQPEMDYSLSALRCMMFILQHVHYKRMEQEEQKIFLQFYTKCLFQVKQLIKSHNTKSIVENFQFDQSKWSKEALIPDHNLPYTIFHKNTSQLLGQIELHYLKDLKEPQARIQYFIRYLTIFQTYYFRYLQKYFIKQGIQSPVLIERYQGRYYDKFAKIQQKWEIGKNYPIGYGNMIECKKLDKNNKFVKLIIVENHDNIVIVEPSNDQNTAKIIINHPWKYAHLEIDRTNGKKMTVRVSKCLRSQTLLAIYFIDEIRSASALEWMHSLKNARYQAEQALIFSYIKDCLVRY